MIKYFASLIALFVLDRITKLYFIENPSLAGGFLSLHINKYIAFSLPLTYFILYPLIFLILVILFSFWLKSFKEKSILIWPWGILIIGSISNLLDRFRYGGVVDFINVPFFTVFNVSDIYISLAVVWILWHSWFYQPKQKSLATGLRFQGEAWDSDSRRGQVDKKKSEY
ncbi:signal peptidase II [Patescibacteria group bacterium]|nr:signal peptidase II [Patescibacteria group bacterium]